GCGRPTDAVGPFLAWDCNRIAYSTRLPRKETLMKIALFGATGTIGQRILEEAVRRGHSVTAVARDPSRITELRAVAGNILEPQSVAAAVAGRGTGIRAFGPRGEAPQYEEDPPRALPPDPSVCRG